MAAANAGNGQLRLQAKRMPLGENLHRANIRTTPTKPAKSRLSVSPNAAKLPHHESLTCNGPLMVSNATSSPENKRLSALTNEDQPDSKRSSQISTTSTNASAKKRKTMIGPWQLGGSVGKGMIGKVRKVRHVTTGQQAAVKIISKKVAEASRAESLADLVNASKATGLAANVIPFGIEREIVIMKLLEHPNVVKLYDVWENKNELFLIMEYVDGGELFDYVNEHEWLDEDETVWIFRQIVAALLHCHRIGIHHRDLKPENILLDNSTNRIKLADFGMAALQPTGKMLTTPCGSLHYAAPEVFEKHYDGSKIDVWSLGVILYVMLCGIPPFHYDPVTMESNVGIWYKKLKAGEFCMPEELSKEAKDLIKRMLNPDSENRITMEAVWLHPLVHKYEALWKEPPGSGNIDYWIGPKPLIGSWNLKRRADIDREVLRSLRTLWHSEREEVLIQKLLSPDPNQEKYFYYALQKHLDEQLENYGESDSEIDTFTSDRHIIKTVERPKVASPVKPVSRTQSQFSILNDEHLLSRSSSIIDPPPSVGSYDPFRASRDRMPQTQNGYTSITVHRTQSKLSQRQSVSSAHRNAKTLRVEALKKERNRLSHTSSSSSFLRSSPYVRAGASRLCSVSKSSVTSSRHPVSPLSGSRIVPSSHKRGVDFSHLRRNSTASVFTTSRTTSNAHLGTPKKEHRKSHLGLLQSSEHMAVESSPSVYADHAVMSKKEALHGAKVALETSSQYMRADIIENEARKVSTELEKFCEEVFFRSSTQSSTGTSVTASQIPYDTPPSSISKGSPGIFDSTRTKDLESATHRPLPGVPSETPNTYMARELTETRKRLAERYAQDEGAQNSAYDEVIAHLDALLQPDKLKSSWADVGRISSAPENRKGEVGSYLPVISEEGRIVAEDEPIAAHRQEIRAATDPFAKSGTKISPVKDIGPTIRLIDAPSPPRIAPLVIRKSSAPTIFLKPSTETQSNKQYASSIASNGKLVRKSSSISPRSLQPISEETLSRDSEESPSNAHIKKSSWFKKRFQAQDIEKLNQLTPPSWDNFVDRSQIEPKRLNSPKEKVQFNLENSPPIVSVFSHQDVISEKRPRFLRFLTRKTAFKKAADAGIADAHSSKNAEALNAFRQTHTLDPSEMTNSGDLGIQRNWFSRFLNIKPVTKILCFNAHRGASMSTVVRLLRRWKQYGMRDIIVDRQRHLISASVDSKNLLGLKAVGFAIEIFIMLKDGRRAKLSIMRLTQTKGAANSFRRVVDEIEKCMSSLDLLVKDPVMWQNMESVLTMS